MNSVFVYLIFFLPLANSNQEKIRGAESIFGSSPVKNANKIPSKDVPFIPDNLVAVMWKTGKLRCTGSLLSSYYVLTAAQCMAREVQDKQAVLYDAFNFAVIYNSLTLNARTDAYESRNIDQIIPHPDFGNYYPNFGHNFDFAVLRIMHPFKPFYLDSYLDSYLSTENNTLNKMLTFKSMSVKMNCTSFGWGSVHYDFSNEWKREKYKFGSDSEELRYLNFKLDLPENCDKDYCDKWRFRCEMRKGYPTDKASGNVIFPPSWDSYTYDQINSQYVFPRVARDKKEDRNYVCAYPIHNDNNYNFKPCMCPGDQGSPIICKQGFKPLLLGHFTFAAGEKNCGYDWNFGTDRHNPIPHYFEAIFKAMRFIRPYLHSTIARTTTTTTTTTAAPDPEWDRRKSMAPPKLTANRIFFTILIFSCFYM